MLLYHYTSIEAALNIVRNGICFWGFRYDSLNDPTDCIFAKDILLSEWSKRNEEVNIDDTFDLFPYVVSFSTEEDYDLMWRLYNAEIALVIDSNKFPYDDWNIPGEYSKSTSYKKVEYANNENVLSVIEEVYNNRTDIIESNPLDEFLLYVLPFIKHEAYSVEKEFRLVKMDSNIRKYKYNSDFPEKSTYFEFEKPYDVKCAGVKDGKLRLYKEFHLPKECLVGVIIHTFDDAKFQTQKKHFELWLRQNNFDISPDFIKKTNSYPVRD